MVSTERIEEKAQQWKQRVDSLFDQIQSWLKNTEFEYKDSETVNLEGTYKKELGLNTPLEFPTAKIFKNRSQIAYLKPKGVRTIGANGRVDLLNNTTKIIIIDKSTPPEEASWEMVIGKFKKERTPLTRRKFIQILNKIG